MPYRTRIKALMAAAALLGFAAAAQAQAPAAMPVPTPETVAPANSAAVPQVSLPSMGANPPPPAPAGAAHPAAPAPASATPTAPAPSAAANAVSAAADNLLSMFNPNTVSGRSQYHSLLFSRSDMDKIYSASRTYLVNMEKMRRLAKLHNGQPMIALQQIQQAPIPTQTLEHPQFFLSLIAYENDDKWALWLNGHQYSDKKRDFGEIHVVSVDNAKARFSWKPRIFGVYEDRLLPGAGSERINVDKKTETVEFTLYPNQSFSAYSMTIEEGYLPPTHIEQISPGVRIGGPSPAFKIDDKTEVGKAGLQALPSAGIYDMPGKEAIMKELSGGR